MDTKSVKNQRLSCCRGKAQCPFSSENFVTSILVQVTVDKCLQCFDAVGWAAGRASGL